MVLAAGLVGMPVISVFIHVLGRIRRKQVTGDPDVCSGVSHTVANLSLSDTQKHERCRSHRRHFLFVARRTREHPTHRRLQLCFEPLRDLRLRETDMERVRRARIPATRYS